MPLELTRRASDDLDDIYAFGLERWGEAQAEKYLAEFWTAADMIDALPLALRERREVTPPVRVHPLRSHLIIYRVVDAGVLVIRVAHASSDWANDLG